MKFSELEIGDAFVFADDTTTIHIRLPDHKAGFGIRIPQCYIPASGVCVQWETWKARDIVDAEVIKIGRIAVASD